jgi:glycerol-3-phosphate dehydrogenase
MNPRLAGIDELSFDAAVIGGGMAGAGVARELALRGVSVALFEKGDFASGTSSKSSKLIHGGLRYLELGDFKLVRESLREKQTLERLAPHLVRPLPFLVPIYRGGKRGLLTVRLGMWLYDLLSPGRRRDRYRVARAVEALSMEPALEAAGLRGAGVYADDLLVYPERLCLENALSAARHGARVHNYCEVEEIVRSRRGLDGLRVRDLMTGKVHAVGARVIVNCAGPWVDRLRELAGVTGASGDGPLLRTTKGIHCLLPRLTERAVYLSSDSDERMIFVIPWREFSLVGTTDTDFTGDPDRLWATREEVEYLLDAVRRVVPDPRVSLDRVAYTYAGVRPLALEPTPPGKRARGKAGRAAKPAASKVSRDHRVVLEGPEGRFMSVTGTKLTCFRSLAEEVGDLVLARLGKSVPSRSGELSLDGMDEDVAKVEARVALDVSADLAASGLAPETVQILLDLYGRGYRRVIELAGKVLDGAERLCPSNPDIVAQLYQAVDQEMAVSLQDVLLRRTSIGQSTCLGLDCAPAIAARMAEMLGWSSRRLEAELEAWQQHVDRALRFRSA